MSRVSQSDGKLSKSRQSLADATPICRQNCMIFQVAAMILVGLLSLHLLKKYYIKVYDLVRRRPAGRGYQFGGALTSNVRAILCDEVRNFSVHRDSVRPEWMSTSITWDLFSISGAITITSVLTYVTSEKKSRNNAQSLSPPTIWLDTSRVWNVRGGPSCSNRIKVDLSLWIIVPFMLTGKNNWRVILLWRFYIA